MRRRTSAILLMALTTLLGACAGRSGPGSSPPPDSVTSTPMPSGPQPQPTPLPVTPRPGLTDPRPVAWQSADVENDTTLLITFYGGVEECYGLDHVQVDYGGHEITVTLYQGRVPGAGVCIEMAVLKSVRVQLDEPVGGRKIVDGAS